MNLTISPNAYEADSLNFDLREHTNYKEALKKVPICSEFDLLLNNSIAKHLNDTDKYPLSSNADAVQWKKDTCTEGTRNFYNEYAKDYSIQIQLGDTDAVVWALPMPHGNCVRYGHEFLSPIKYL